ncbi:MAG: 2-C-methyl-D-erythritol 4-phosphate cytidylyltransferase [Candidatus Krumholzibacteria bacterium]|nr:2-C-methyl-D-erythritol 4-phosphate cytidylyltransferase [Candidatus Krumholzibacteria bacterium]
MKERIVCLVAAAGRGVRFGREMPKSFYPVEGRPLLGWSLRALNAWGCISRYVVMVPAGWEAEAGKELAAEVPGASGEVLVGGETRQESVAMGLASISDADLVLVHDACRPIVSVALISRVVEAAREHGAAVPALGVTETLGRLRDDVLEGIVPRERVVGIQTPQAFKFDCIKKAFSAAGEAIRSATDESSLVLSAGFPVKVVEGEVWNIKVTVKEDLEIMGSFLSGRKLALPPCAGD